MKQLWDMGYAASDIMGTLIATAKRIDMDEALRLELVKVSNGAIVAGASLFFFIGGHLTLLFFLCIGRCGHCRTVLAARPGNWHHTRARGAWPWHASPTRWPVGAHVPCQSRRLQPSPAMTMKKKRLRTNSAHSCQKSTRRFSFFLKKLWLGVVGMPLPSSAWASFLLVVPPPCLGVGRQGPLYGRAAWMPHCRRHTRPQKKKPAATDHKQKIDKSQHAHRRKVFGGQMASGRH
ncbi:replication factor small subunit [Pandoravirus inopinatum]|uniref:Replication factor small subunit n=1 Tax=Pandoravirus inopinatum TaxID=1605721 RepID=A0A0B5J5P8_9VIRU|nr:replication factor small subunit [Pandoravirus inopinatum]AJF97005.1 replication factor small subunit [Pandoravirus inopinatum]